MRNGIHIQNYKCPNNSFQIRQSFYSGHDEENAISVTNKHRDRQLFNKAPKILVVEDDNIIQKINMLYLETLGCKADLAKDGFEAIELFQNGYDLILLDIGLPDRNGIKKSGVDVVKEIRRFERETGIKQNIIVAITAYGNPKLEECMKAGCNDFYIKPLLIDTLAEVLQGWLPNFVNKPLKDSDNQTK
jgi:CheY-like chemotaxis protein